jgi:hypothetical protein
MSPMKLHVLWPFAFGLAFILTVNSCTKTVTGPTDSVIVRDTSRDTLHDTLGTHQAWVRFVSMIPDSIATEIILSKTQDANASQFAYALNSVSGNYLPLRSDTSYLFYLSNPNRTGWSTTLNIPTANESMKTWALFWLSNQVRPIPSTDSEKLTPPPPGYCYVRFMDGINDPSGSPTYFFDLDTVYHDLVPIQDLQISQYVLVKAGEHTLFLRESGTSNTPLQVPGNFEDGSYYTVRATGSFTANNAKLTLDQE